MHVSVFSVAWMRALSPSNIVAGFKKCGHSIRTPTDANEQSSNDSVATHSATLTRSTNMECPTETVEPLPPDKLQLFRKRFEEGYDIPDPEYDQWLNQTHLEAAFLTLEFQIIHS